MYEWEDKVSYGWIISIGCNVYTIICDRNFQVVFNDLLHQVLHFLQSLPTTYFIFSYLSDIFCCYFKEKWSQTMNRHIVHTTRSPHASHHVEDKFLYISQM